MAEAAPVITATLRGVTRQPGVTKAYLSGFCYDDQLGRFRDGEYIHTSSILREVEPDLFETRSGSFYRVETWAEIRP